MIVEDAKNFLGSQIWIEPYDSKERVEALVEEAAKSGLGWLRTFLMWPWIEEEPGKWDFTVFDYLFDACAKNGIKVKATLTANSGPWHIGTPVLLHSHTGILDEVQWPAIEKYVEKCVTRYCNHPALGQWILWNEPCGAWDKSKEARAHWQVWLKDVYNGDITTLNRRWRTGYADFSCVQFPEEIPHPAQQGNAWRSYRPDMDYAKFNAKWIEWELSEIQRLVRRYDAKTPTCVNPSNVLNNDMASGVNLDEMGQIVDYLGASYHPAWHFTYADRELFPALMAVGVKKTASFKNVRHVEVTEVQTGNTLNSSTKPCNVEPSELARFYLSSIFSGAESVTGWLLNPRSYDFEAGDWGLLNNNDKQSPRSIMTYKVKKTLDQILQKTGGFKLALSQAFVAFDHDAQAVELVESTRGGSVSGRMADDSAHGGAILTARLMQNGVNASMCRLCDIPDSDSEGKMLFVSHVVAWSNENAKKILRFAFGGGTVVLDCTSGRKTPDAELYRPWPGGVAETIGMVSADLETNPKGYEVSLFGETAGEWLLTKIALQFAENGQWRPWSEPRYAKDGAPCVYERPLGNGKIILVNGLLGPSLLYASERKSALNYILRVLTKDIASPVRPAVLQDAAYVLPVECTRGSLFAVFANSDRNGKKLLVAAPQGEYVDLWTGEKINVPETGEVALKAEDGIVLLWKEQ